MKTIELIRKEIEKSGKTKYRIAKDTGLDKAQLTRILAGKTITLETAEKLLAYFGYELKKTK